MNLFDVTFKALDQAVGATGMRQQTLSNNLANVNTPGFKRSDVQFEDLIAKALDKTKAGNEGAFGALEIAPTTDTLSVMRQDGNNVDVDVEMSNLAENNVRYNALVQLAAKKMSTLSYVISDGRR